MEDLLAARVVQALGSDLRWRGLLEVDLLLLLEGIWWAWHHWLRWRGDSLGRTKVSLVQRGMTLHWRHVLR